MSFRRGRSWYYGGVRSCYEGKQTAETLAMDYHRGAGVELGSCLWMVECWIRRLLVNFERAKAAIKVESEKEEKINNSFHIIYKQFVEILGSVGVVFVETTG
ncbi:hypothetical protein L1987_13471 [Smallanthus sonchifolius]|uniref:Uncharacterized protein n=1 Tax=Smallanthus sonchifolius TaxID=185202 RepID=A0ACB9JH63_9ASTR|nr:hypothetical protein L1987_13471 [Smallanthus sonchifolius]